MPRWTASAVALAVVALVGACSSGADRQPAAAAPHTGAGGATTTTVTTTTIPRAPTTTTGLVPPFTVTVAPVAAADVPATWRDGCPVGPDQLRLLTLSHWGFDDQPHVGTIVVNASVADAVTSVFASLYAQRFPIRGMQPVDAFGGRDDASIAADNTAGFNCRDAVAVGPPQWSQHAYGLAIDVNPLENPAVVAGVVMPPAGADHLDRADVRPGMAVDGGPLVEAFAAVGWGWGGHWRDVDYQHFSANGR